MHYADRLIAINASIIGSNTILNWRSWHSAKNASQLMVNWPNRECEEEFWLILIEFMAACAAAQVRADFVLNNGTITGDSCTAQDVVMKALEVRLNIISAWPQEPHKDLVQWARAMIKKMDNRTDHVAISESPMVELEGVGEIIYIDEAKRWTTRNPRKKPEVHALTGKPAVFVSPLDALDFLLKKRKSLPAPPVV